jgi:hypothetical protein
MTPSQLPGFGHRLRFLSAVLAWGVATTAAAFEPSSAPRSHLLPVSEVIQPPTDAFGLGVTLSRASPVLRRQLSLRRGAGLVVDAVTPGSLAAGAGFEPHDVVVRLDDQLLVLPEQLDALLEARDDLDPLVCTVLRGGRELALPLGGGKPVRLAAQLVRPTAPARSLRPTASSLAILQPARQPLAQGDPRLRRLADETLLREDGDFRIQLTRGDELRLSVTDVSGRLVFDAAIDTPAARGSVPEVIRARVAEMVTLLEPQPAATGQFAEAGLPPGRPPQPASPPPRIGRLEIPPVELH